MNVLPTLLPGVRELRTPLISGYLLLLSLWIALWGKLPEEVRTAERVEGSHLEPVVALIEMLGPIGGAVAVSVAAYLAGSLVVYPVIRLVERSVALSITPSGAIRLGGIIQRFVDKWVEELGLESAVGIDDKTSIRDPYAINQAEAREWVSQRLSTSPQDEFRERRIDEQTKDLCAAIDAWELRRESVREISQTIDILGMQGSDKARSVYQILDRNKAEAEFRIGILLPVMALVASLATLSWWFVLGVVLPALVGWEGVARHRATGDRVVSAMEVLGDVRTPTLIKAEEALAGWSRP